MGGRRETRTRRQGCKAQSSMEFLLVTVFAFILLAGILIIAYAQSSSFSTDITSAQVQKVGMQLTDAANTVYYAGPPTKKTMTVYIPEHVTNISIGGSSVLFTLQGPGGISQYSAIAVPNLTGSLQPFAGIHVVTIEAQAGAVNITG